jgi:D-amino-acid dehydrogenase
VAGGSDPGGDGVVVIGAGVVGVSAAYYLARAGARVTLLDQADVAAGSSYGNAGLVVPSHSIPLAAPGVWWQGLKWMGDPESPFYVKPRPDPALARWLWRFRRACTEAHVRQALPLLRELHYASLALYRELCGVDGLDFGFRQEGTLGVSLTEAAHAGAVHEAERLVAAGLPARVLDGPAARSLEPALAPGVAGAVLFPDDALLIPDRFVRGLARVAASLGVRVRAGTEVLGFRTAGARIVAVETTRGDLVPDEVVLAAGAWSPRLGRELGLELPVEAAKGYSVTFARPPAPPRRPLLCHEVRVGVTPMDGTLRFAGTLELAGLDLSIDRRRVAALVRGVSRYLATPPTEVQEVWRGLRPCTPDGLPIVGRPGRPANLVIATGHAMIGMSLGPITGQLVADLVAGRPPSIDIALLRPQRFA